MMLNDFVEKIRDFLMKPVGTFRKSREDTLGNAFTYYILLVAINTILTILVLFAGIRFMGLYQHIPEMNGPLPAILIAGIIVGGIVGVFIAGAGLHIFIWLLGGREGYIQTVKALMYGLTPGLLIGWIPFVGIIGVIWDLILVVLGVRELQEMSTGRAVAAVVIPAVISTIIVILIAALFFISLMSSAGPSQFYYY